MSSIHTRRWFVPDSRPVQSRGVYLLHGLGEHTDRYGRLAEWLTQRGWVVAAHDHPGHGRSDGIQGVLNPAGALATQAAIQVQSFARETGAPPVLLGHSLGGVLAAELVLAHELPVAGLVLSAPALMPNLSAWEQAKLQLLHRLAPDFRINRPYDTSRLTHDAEEAKVAASDPLRHGYVSAGLIKWMIESGRRSIDACAGLNVDTLLLLPGADKVVNPLGFRAFERNAPAARLSIRRYADSYHEVFNEAPVLRERAMADLTDWLETRRFTTDHG